MAASPARPPRHARAVGHRHGDEAAPRAPPTPARRCATGPATGGRCGPSTRRATRSRWAAPAQFGTALGAAWDALPVWASSPPGGKSSGWAFLRGSVRISTSRSSPRPSTRPARPPSRPASTCSGCRSTATVLGVGPARPPDPVTGTEYSAWDVTRALTPGNDTFGALAYAASTRGFQLELVVEYKDGTRQAWGTRSDWQALDGGAVYPAAGSVSPRTTPRRWRTWTREHYPFGLRHPRLPRPRRAGRRAAVQGGDHGLTPLPPPTCTPSARKPVKVTTLGPGQYLLDFGATQVGGLRLTLDGTAGREGDGSGHGEVLSGPKSVQYQLSAGHVHDDTWTLRAGTADPAVLGIPRLPLRGGHQYAAADDRHQHRRPGPGLPGPAVASRR